MLETRGGEIALQGARIEVEPGRRGIGEPYRRHPLIREPPGGQRLGAHGPGRQQGIERQIARQIDARDAGDGFDAAQGRIEVLRGVTDERHRNRGLAGSGIGRPGSGGRLAAVACFPLHDDAHRLQGCLPLLRRFRRHVEQDQRPGLHILQLNPCRLNGLARQEIDRPARALHAQPLAEMARHADAHVAIDEDDALLSDHERHRERQTLPAQKFDGPERRNEDHAQNQNGKPPAVFLHHLHPHLHHPPPPHLHPHPPPHGASPTFHLSLFTFHFSPFTFHFSPFTLHLSESRSAEADSHSSRAPSRRGCVRDRHPGGRP